MIRNPRAITAASFTASFFLGVGYSVVGAVARDLGLAPAQIGLLLACQNIGYGAGVAVTGALADTHSRPRLLFFGSVILALGFFAFFRAPIFWVNVLIMLLIGLGIGSYEGVTDVMLFDLHETRAAFFININHLFVTVGSGLIALYLIFLSLDWRSALTQAAVAVTLLAIVFLLIRLEQKRRSHSTFREKLAVIGQSRLILILFFVTALLVGVEACVQGLISTYLADVRGLATLPSKLSLVIFMAGMAVGRLFVGSLTQAERLRQTALALFAAATVAFALLFLVDLGRFSLPMAFIAGLTLSAQLPLILAYAGLVYPDIRGAVLGAVKISIPLGGIILPLLISTATSAASFAIALWIVPLALLLALLLLALPAAKSEPVSEAII